MRHRGRSSGLNPGARSLGRSRGSRLLIGLVAVGLVVGASAATAAAAADDGSHSPDSAHTGATHTGTGYDEHRGAYGEVDVNVCSYATSPGVAHCNARVRTDAAAQQLGSGLSAQGVTPAALPGGAYGPPDLQAAYGTVTASATVGTGRTVAIVDAYDDPNAESDLATYRAAAVLPACTTVNSCFKKVNQNGGTSYPAADVGWAEEISLDLDMVSAMCPLCKVLLVEANSNSFADLGVAVNRAASMGAIAISNSYGGGEFNGESSFGNAYFNHPGVAVTVSSGDNGYGVEYPAASPNVIAVGGTTLQKSGGVFTETAWSGAGSGCSAYEAKPSWQHDPGCTRRTVADVSAVADPATGVLVYDSFGITPGWYAFGGTSVASPIIASIAALAGGPWTNPPASSLYAQPGALHDVVAGSNGGCGSYLCNAAVGFDGPTGLGTPNTTAAFVGAPAASDFSLSASPSSVSLSANGIGSSAITLTGLNGFNGTATLAASVNGNGVNATLSPATLSSGGSATLGLAAVSAGTYIVTITASSGSLVHTATVTVTVAPAVTPNFSIAVSPSSRSVTRGSSTTYTVTITRTGGFAGSVTLGVTGQTSRDTASFSKNPIASGSTTSVLTIRTSRSDARSTRSLTITGTSGALSHSVNATLVLR